MHPAFARKPCAILGRPRMTTDAAPLLLSTVDHADPGDETFRRYRYQATYAAMLAVGLLEERTDVAEVYCEQYEDILLHLQTGTFRGVQVKTKADGGAPLRATDEPILDSLLRFVELDMAFPRLFEGFTLATNAAFDRAGKGVGNLFSLVEEARVHAADSAAPCSKAWRFSKTLVDRHKKKHRTGKLPKSRKVKTGSVNATPQPSKPGHCAAAPHPTQTDVLQVLAKLDVRDDLPKVPDIRSRLQERLVALSPKVAASTLPIVNRVVDALEHAAYLAASRVDEDRNGRNWFVADPAKRASLNWADEIQAKRLSREDVESAINSHCSGSLLISAEPVTPEQIPDHLPILEKKLVAGGLSVATLSLARDAVASVEEFGTQMLYMYDQEEGLRRYNHARAVVKKECAIAYESQAAAGEVNGPRMLAEVDARLKQRRADDRTGVLKECEEEHLLGHVFALTGECIVWWSTSRDLGRPQGPKAPKGGDDE